jgi:hypothetical protein
MAAKVLIWDIETAPILGYAWGLFDQNIGLNQVHTDWHLLAWSAKWLGDAPSKTMYMDQRNAKDITDDKKILEALWKLLNEADIVISQNGKRFDQKKVNARFVFHGMQPPSSYKHIDTCELAKRHFGFTSNKLAYMTDKLNTKYKKLEHTKFPGFELWKQCLAGNIKAWDEMKRYNKYDVLSLEELYTKLIPWDSTVNFSLYYDNEIQICSCGSQDFRHNGYHFTAAGKFQRFRCKKCGAEGRHNKNLFSKEKKDSLLRRTKG